MLIASKMSFASTCVALTFPYHVEPPTFDMPPAKASICETVRLVAPPNADDTLTKVEHVGM